MPLKPDEIGRRVKALRKARKLTQPELAKMLNVTGKHISSIERGLSCLSLEKTVRLCEIFGCGLGWLVLGSREGEVTIPDNIRQLLSPENEDELRLLMDYLDMYRRLRGR